MKRWCLLAIVPLVALWVAVPVSGNGIPSTNLKVAGSPGLTLSPSTGKPGTGVTAQVTGFTRSSVVVVSFNGVAVNGSGSPVALVSAQLRAYVAGPGRGPLASGGNASVPFRVPDLPAGRYAVTAKGYTSAPPSGGQPTNTPAVPTDTPVPPTETSTSTATATNTTVPAATPTNTLVPPPATATSTQPAATATSTFVLPTVTNTVPVTNSQPCPGANPNTTVCVGGTSIPRPFPTSTFTPTPTVTATYPPNPQTTSFTTGFPGFGQLPNVPQQVATSVPVRCSTAGCTNNGSAPYGSSAHFKMPAAPAPGIGQVPTQVAGPSYPMMAAGARQVRQAAAGLTFSGDQASAIFTITAPSVPFSLSQSASCAGTIVVGQQTTCTITEMVTNNGVHTLDFSHTVVNHISPNVRVVSASSSTGTIAASGNNVTWSSFSLAPNQSASAAIQVSFTPNQSQVSSSIPLSNGITADAVDVTTHQRFTLSYGPLATKARVQAATGKPSGGRQPAGNVGGAQPQSGVSGLPSTGGAAHRRKAIRIPRE